MYLFIFINSFDSLCFYEEDIISLLQMLKSLPGGHMASVKTFWSHFTPEECLSLFLFLFLFFLSFFVFFFFEPMVFLLFYAIFLR